jgi:hypothetical protein
VKKKRLNYSSKNGFSCAEKDAFGKTPLDRLHDLDETIIKTHASVLKLLKNGSEIDSSGKNSSFKLRDFPHPENSISYLANIDNRLTSVMKHIEEIKTDTIIALDATQTEQDRKHLNIKAQYLIKGSICRELQRQYFNNLNPLSYSSLSYWSSELQTLAYMNFDSKSIQKLDLNLSSGHISANKIPYAFTSRNAFTLDHKSYCFSANGRYLFYLAQDSYPELDIYQKQTLMRLELKTNLLTYNPFSSEECHTASFRLDEENRIWILSALSSDRDKFKIALLDQENLTFDYGKGRHSKWEGIDISSVKTLPIFSVHKDLFYHLCVRDNNEIEVIANNIYNSNDHTTLITLPIKGSTLKLLAISPNGKFLSWIESTPYHTHRITIASTDTLDNYSIDSQPPPLTLQFDHYNRLFWTHKKGEDDKKFHMEYAYPHVTSTDDETIGRILFTGPIYLGSWDIEDRLSPSDPNSCQVQSIHPYTAFHSKNNQHKKLEGFAIRPTFDMSLTTLGLSGIDLSTIDKARESFQSLDQALKKVIFARVHLSSMIRNLSALKNSM